MKRVCVFCGSRPGARPAYVEAASATGRLLAERGLGLVFGGGKVGLMGAVADAVLAAGGEVVGVIPGFLVDVEVEHTGVTTLEVVDDLHTRKARMAELSDAFLALPGGLGTFEELFEIVSWAQLRLHEKPIGVLDVEGYAGPLRTLLDRAVGEGFVRPEHRELIVIADDPRDLLDGLSEHRAIDVPKI